MAVSCFWYLFHKQFTNLHMLLDFSFNFQFFSLFNATRLCRVGVRDENRKCKPSAISHDLDAICLRDIAGVWKDGRNFMQVIGDLRKVAESRPNCTKIAAILHLWCSSPARVRQKWDKKGPHLQEVDNIVLRTRLPSTFWWVMEQSSS